MRDSWRALLARRGFQSLFWTQFLAAFNDNLFKNLLVMWLSFSAGVAQPALWVTMAAGVFVLPFLLFSPWAGAWVDRNPPHRTIRLTQTAEIVIMALAALGFALESPAWLMGTLFAMGVQSSLFGPVKYSVLPRFFRGEVLVAVNSVWNGSTFVAILLGTLVGTGGFLLFQGVAGLMGLSIGVAALGAWAAWRAPPCPAPPPVGGETSMGNPVRALWRTIRFARAHVGWRAMLAISGFWMIGAMVLSQVPVMARALGDESWTLWLLSSFTASVGAGVALAWRLNRAWLRLAWTKYWYGLILLAGAALVWAWPDRSWLWQPAFMLLGFGGGAMVVPLYVYLQRCSDDAHRGRIFAALNVLNALGMVFGAAVLMGYHALR